MTTFEDDRWYCRKRETMWTGSLESAAVVHADFLQKASPINALQVVALYLSEIGIKLSWSDGGTGKSGVRFLPSRSLADTLEVRSLDPYGAYIWEKDIKYPVSFRVRLRPLVDDFLRDLSDAFELPIRENLEIPDNGLLVLYTDTDPRKVSVDPSHTAASGFVWPSHLWSSEKIQLLQGVQGHFARPKEMKDEALALSFASKLGQLHALRLAAFEENREGIEGSPSSAVWKWIKNTIRKKLVKKEPLPEEHKSIDGREEESFSSVHNIDQLEQDLSKAEVCLGHCLSHNNICCESLVFDLETPEAFILPPTNCSLEPGLMDIADYFCHAVDDHRPTSLLPHENFVHQFLSTYFDSRQQAEQQNGVAPRARRTTAQLVTMAFTHLPTFVKISLVRQVLKCAKSENIEDQSCFCRLRELKEKSTPMYAKESQS